MRRQLHLLAAATLGLTTVWLPAAAHGSDPTPPVPLSGAGGQTYSFTLYDGSRVTVGTDGLGTITEAAGRHSRPFATAAPQGISALGDQPGPDRTELIRRLSTRRPGRGSPGDVVLVLTSGAVDGAATKGSHGQPLRAAHTTDPRVNAVLHAVGATTADDLSGTVPGDAPRAATAAGQDAGGVDLSRAYVVHVTGTDADRAARALRGTPGVAYAEPDSWVSTFDARPVPLPSWATRAGAAAATTTPSGATAAPSTPSGATTFGDRGIQLDPATRTGWTFGPGDSQVQQFSY